MSIGHQWASHRMDHTFKKVSRSEAMALCQPFYWTGKPCEHGHTTFRRTSTGECIRCESYNPKPRVEKPLSKMLEIDRWKREHEAPNKEVWEDDEQ